MTLAAWLAFLELAAIVAGAASGLLVAARQRLDVVGATVVASATAFGGGTLRDVLLDRRPFFWVEHHVYLWGVIGFSLLAWPLLVRGRISLSEKMLVIPDAVGLGLFGATGVGLATQAGMPVLIAVLMGVVTATFGGLLRDLLCNRLPVVLHDHRPYAICAFVGAWIQIGLTRIDIDPSTAALAGAIVAAVFRLIAWWRDWRLPGWPSP